MKAEYEFEWNGNKFLAKADAHGKVHAYERNDDDSDWVGVDFGPNPFAAELLMVVGILDGMVEDSGIPTPAIVEREAREKGEL